MGGVAEEKVVVAGCEGCFISLMVSAGESSWGTCQGCVDNKGWQATKATTREPTLLKQQAAVQIGKWDITRFLLNYSSRRPEFPPSPLTNSFRT
jgi:hypothetical protein